MVSPKRMPTFWDVSVAMRWGRIRDEGVRQTLLHHFVDECLRTDDAGVSHDGQTFLVANRL